MTNFWSPYNAVLSPDGEYLLIAAHNSMSKPALFMYHMETGICGRIDLSAFGEYRMWQLAPYDSPVSYPLRRGMYWVGNNRVLINIDGTYYITEFAFE
jgi:hypothetical protein